MTECVGILGRRWAAGGGVLWMTTEGLFSTLEGTNPRRSSAGQMAAIPECSSSPSAKTGIDRTDDSDDRCAI